MRPLGHHSGVGGEPELEPFIVVLDEGVVVPVGGTLYGCAVSEIASDLTDTDLTDTERTPAMTLPVIPPARRACTHTVSTRPARVHGELLPRSASPCTTTARARRTVIPFGRDSAGTSVSWDLSVGRNLLIARDEHLAPPSVSLDLVAMTVLSGDTHELFVLDPHQRHRWIAELGSRRPAESHRAVTPEQISRVVASLASTRVVRPRMLLVADLASTVAALDDAGRQQLADVAVAGYERQVTLVATTADPNPRWFPAHLIEAFDDIVEPNVVAGRRHEQRLRAR